MELEVLGRLQLKYSRTGRRDSVGSTGTLGLGCLGRTHAIFAELSRRVCLCFDVGVEGDGRIWLCYELG